MPPPKLLAWWQKRFEKIGAGDTASVASAGLSANVLAGWDSPDQAIAFGQRIVFYGVFCFLAWAALAPLDEGIPASGNVTVESRRKAIAPLVSGLVASFNAMENQRVKAGEILLTLENAQPQANYDGLVQQHFAMAAKLARLEAEQRRDNQLQLPSELVALDKHAWAREILAAEVNLLGTRNEALESEMAILRERIAGNEEKMRGAQQQLSARRKQYDLLGEQVGSLNRLVEAGHSPRSQLLDTQRNYLETGRLASELETTIAVSSNAVAELHLQQTQRRKEVLRDIEAQIVDARRDLTLLKERLKAAQEELDRTVIKAPIDGQIVSLQGLAAGSTVSAGTHLMDIIPEGDKLMIDVQVSPHMIDRVQPEMVADVRINAFPQDPQLVIAGKIVSVSADQLQGSPTSPPYYLARIEITPEGMQQLGQRKLRPGMPAEAIIKTGERSFLSYLVKPLTRRLFTSFREI